MTGPLRRAGARLGLAVALAGLPPPAAAGELETVPLPGLRAEVAALLMQGVAGGGLPIAAAVFAAPAGDGQAAGELSFLVELPPAEPALPARPAAERPLELYVYAVDDDGEVAAHYAVSLPRWPAAGEGVKLAGRLAAAPAGLSVRFLAWDPAARRYGMTVRRLAPGAAPATPRIVDDCAGWAVAGGDLAELTRLSARPVMVSGERRRLSPDGAAAAGGWRIRLTGGEGSAAGREVAAPAATPGVAELAVPADLAAGVYQLAVAAADGAAWSSPPLEVWLVPELPPADGGCRRSWGAVLRHARAGVAAAAPGPPAAPARGRRGRRLAEGYRALLGRLAATGELAAAAGRLAELEGLIVAGDATRVRLLFDTELAVAAALAAEDPRSLLPLIALHAETYRLHHGAGRFPLASHSRRLAAAVAELAVAAGSDREERRLVSMAITGLAEMVETRRASIEAQRLLERALQLDDGLEAARLLLAISYERKGRYEDGRRQMERLVAANSAHWEGRARLAILLRRMGRPAEAEPLLRALVAERPPDWLLSLGYQTLAQLLIREERLAEAVVELERAGRRLPGDQALRILLAYARDRLGERQAVRQTLAELPLGLPAVTPRYRYSDEPAAALGLLRETLRQSVTVHLPLLALALAVDRAGGGAP